MNNFLHEDQKPAIETGKQQQFHFMQRIIRITFYSPSKFDVVKISFYMSCITCYILAHSPFETMKLNFLDEV